MEILATYRAPLEFKCPTCGYVFIVKYGFNGWSVGRPTSFVNCPECGVYIHESIGKTANKLRQEVKGK